MNKKNVALVILMLVSILLIYKYVITPKAAKYAELTKYGKFEKVGRLNSTHINSDVMKLEDGRILILGDDLKNEPSEIYDPKIQKVSEYKFPGQISINNRGISLPNNQILIIGVCVRRGERCIEYRNNNIALYDISTKKFLQYNFFKKFDNVKFYDYFYMKDGKVIFIITDEEIEKPTSFVIGIYNIRENTVKYSKEYKIQSDTGCPKGIPINKNEILILQDKSKILKYNITNNTIKETKSENLLENSSYTLIGDKVLIIGSLKGYYDCINEYNLIYDIKSDEISKVPPILTTRGLSTELLQSYKPIYGILALSGNNILITGGKGGPKSYNVRGLPLKEAEIFDLNKKEFVNLPKMNCTHNSHKSILLDNGDVLLLGGETYCGKLYIYNTNKNKSVIERFRLKRSN